MTYCESLLFACLPLELRPDFLASLSSDDTSVGLGSCGILHQNSEYTVALNSADMNAYGSSYPSPACGKQIWITYGGKTVTASIQDTCPTCPQGGLDLSEGLFSALADQSVGVIYASWGYGSSGGNSDPTTTKKADPTTTWKPEPTTTWTPEPTTTWTPEVKTSTKAPEPTTTWTPAEETTSPAPVQAVASTTSSSAPAAASSAEPLFFGTWAEHVQAMTCPNETLILWNNTEVIYNGTYSTELNGTNTLWGNATSMLINTMLPNVTEYCYNATMSLFNGTAFFLEANTTANSTTLFNLFTTPLNTTSF